jgi:hypothetical protein
MPPYPPGSGQFAAIQSVAPALKVELTPINVYEATEIESAVADFARVPNGGLIVTGGPLAVKHRNLIAALASETSGQGASCRFNGSYHPVRSFWVSRLNSANMSQVAINMAATTGPITKPLTPKTAIPPSVDISTT